MFSTDTEEEARQLIVLTCPRTKGGEYVARELVEEQTIENLQAFSDRLQTAWDFLQKRREEKT